MDEHHVTGQVGTSQVNDVAMVREEQDLGSLRQLGQGGQCGGCANIVEVEQDVVYHERNRLMRLKPRFEACQPQSKIKLIM